MGPQWAAIVLNAVGLVLGGCLTFTAIKTALARLETRFDGLDQRMERLEDFVDRRLERLEADPRQVRTR